jgi:chromate reductase
MNPKILVFAGSIRNGSFNARLAALAAKELTLADGDVTHISLADYPLPLYDGNLEALNGPPNNAIQLKRLFCQHEGIFIVSPEYNASVTPLLKNTIDWVSRVREGREPPLAAYKSRAFAIAGASPGPFGAMRSLMALRQVLEIGCGALVIPEMVAVREAANAFDEMDNLKDERAAGALKSAAARLIAMARRME